MIMKDNNEQQKEQQTLLGSLVGLATSPTTFPRTQILRIPGIKLSLIFN